MENVNRIEFLRARIDEDEQWAQAAQDGDGYADWDNPSTGVVQVAGGELDGLALAPRNAAIHMARHDPARVLREVEAKRQILDHYEQVREAVQLDLYGEPRETYVLAVGAVERVIRMLALPYADHEDYRPEWAPTVDA